MQIFATIYVLYCTTITASDGSFLPIIYSCVYILNDNSIYIDGLATLWENYQVS